MVLYGLYTCRERIILKKLREGDTEMKQTTADRINQIVGDRQRIEFEYTFAGIRSVEVLEGSIAYVLFLKALAAQGILKNVMVHEIRFS